MKSFERLVLRRLVNRVDTKLSKAQAGFRAKDSCIDNIFQLRSEIQQWSNIQKMQSKPIIAFQATFIDFSKAFDRVWHDGLLYKLNQVGIKGKAWHWCAFLSNRSIRVVNGGHYSNWFPISAGVPQGAVLSPLWFIIYINDLVNKLLRSLAFADDIVLWHPDHSRAGLRNELTKLVSWSWTWKMVINPKKSAIVPFAYRYYKEYDTDEYSITTSSYTGIPSLIFNFQRQYKYLGIVFNHNLNKVKQQY
jgi:hypothetical protein